MDGAAKDRLIERLQNEINCFSDQIELVDDLNAKVHELATRNGQLELTIRANAVSSKETEAAKEEAVCAIMDKHKVHGNLSACQQRCTLLERQLTCAEQKLQEAEVTAAMRLRATEARMREMQRISQSQQALLQSRIHSLNAMHLARQPSEKATLSTSATVASTDNTPLKRKRDAANEVNVSEDALLVEKSLAEKSSLATFAASMLGKIFRSKAGESDSGSGSGSGSSSSSNNINKNNNNNNKAAGKRKRRETVFYDTATPALTTATASAVAPSIASNSQPGAHICARRNRLWRHVIDSSPLGFELCCAAMLEVLGYQVSHQGQTGDHGIDLALTKGGQQHVVQCKRWFAKIGESQIREFYGVMTHEVASRGFFITTSSYTAQARLYADGIPSMNLWDKDTILKLLEEHGGEVESRMVKIERKWKQKQQKQQKQKSKTKHTNSSGSNSSSCKVSKGRPGISSNKGSTTSGGSNFCTNSSIVGNGIFSLGSSTSSALAIEPPKSDSSSKSRSPRLPLTALQLT